MAPEAGHVGAVVFRADAAFAKPKIYEALEERGVKYAIRVPAHENLQRDIAELLTRRLFGAMVRRMETLPAPARSKPYSKVRQRGRRLR